MTPVLELLLALAVFVILLAPVVFVALSVVYAPRAERGRAAVAASRELRRLIEALLEALLRLLSRG